MRRQMRILANAARRHEACIAQSITCSAIDRRHHLDHRDLRARGLVADRVHHVRRLQRQQPRLLDHAARLGDALQRHGLLGDRLAERHARLGALAHASSARSALPISRMQ